MKSLAKLNLASKFRGKAVSAIAVALIIVGGLAIGYNLFNYWLAGQINPRPKVLSQVVSNAPATPSSDPVVKGQPDHISIPSVGIDLNVIPGYYNKADNSWTLTKTNAQWGAVTTEPNNKAGDTYIYGHALMNVFGRLPNIQPGGTAQITTSNGHTFTYSFTQSIQTTPDDTSLFNYQGRPILILQTCSGEWYQYRQLFVFNLESVDQKPIASNL